MVVGDLVVVARAAGVLVVGGVVLGVLVAREALVVAVDAVVVVNLVSWPVARAYAAAARSFVSDQKEGVPTSNSLLVLSTAS